MTTIRVSIDKVIPDDDQPRKQSGFDDESIGQLAETISSVGILHDIVVTELADGNYKIVVGERRYRAALKAGLTEIDVKVCNMTDDERLEAQLIEDICRRDIDIRDRATALKRHVAKYPDQKTAAKKLGFSAARLSQLLELTQLHPDVVELLDKKLTGDSSTLIAANKLAKAAPEKLAELIEDAEKNGKKLTRKDVVAAAAPFSTRKPKKDTVDPVTSEPIGTTGIESSNTSGDSSSESNDSHQVVQVPLGFEKVLPAKLRKVRSILHIPETLSPADLIERLVDELLKRESQ